MQSGIMLLPPFDGMCEEAEVPSDKLEMLQQKAGLSMVEQVGL